MISFIVAATIWLAQGPPNGPAIDISTDTVRIAPGSTVLDASRLPRGAWVYDLSVVRGDGSTSTGSQVRISIRDTTLPEGPGLVIRHFAETSRGPVSIVSLLLVAGMRPVREAYQGPDGELNASWIAPATAGQFVPDSAAFSDMQLVTLLGSAAGDQPDFTTTRAVLNPGRTSSGTATVTSRIESGKRIMTLKSGELEYVLTYRADGLLFSRATRMFDGGTITEQLVGG